MPSVISTMTNDTEFCEWIPDTDLPRKGPSVVIKGGAGRAQKRTLVTPLGVATIVSQEELDFLLKNAMFNKHVEDGFLKVVRSSRPDADRTSKDMEPRDGSAPMTNADFERINMKTPKTADGEVVSEITTQPRFVPKVNKAFAAR